MESISSVFFKNFRPEGQRNFRFVLRNRLKLNLFGKNFLKYLLQIQSEKTIFD